MVDGFVTFEEIEEIERECGRSMYCTIFNSRKEKWDKCKTLFDVKMKSQSHFLILFETTDYKRFGFYLNAFVDEIDKYIEDSNAFLLSFKDNNSLQKYKINEPSNALKICQNDSDDLFIIGRNDVVIKKNQKKN